MNDKNLSNVLADFETFLRCDVENSNLTVKKYLSETRKFLEWLYDDKHLTIATINKQIILNFKDYLCEKYDNPDTVNGKLGMNHIFLKFLSFINLCKTYLAFASGVSSSFQTIEESFRNT